jgi:hypothetical protein
MARSKVRSVHSSTPSTPKKRERLGQRDGGPEWHVDLIETGRIASEDDLTDRHGRRWTVTLAWTVIGTRPEVYELSVRSAETPPVPVSASLIRSLPLGELEREIRASLPELASSYAAQADAAGEGLLSAYDRWYSKSQAFRYLAEHAGPQRGRTLSDDVLHEIADVYKAAHANKRPVTRAVADAFHVSISAAGKRIMAARAAGLLDDIDNPKGSE